MKEEKSGQEQSGGVTRETDGAIHKTDAMTQNRRNDGRIDEPNDERIDGKLTE